MRGLAIALAALGLLPCAVAAAPFEAGTTAYQAGNYEEALAIWRPLAEEGNAAAQIAIAAMYAKGRGIAQSDFEAMKWYRKAAEQGDVEAQFQVGAMYSEGKGVPQDRTKAAPWFEKAAKQGHGEAQHAIAWMYATGDGKPRDYVQAYAWFSVSAAQGVRKSAKKRDRALERVPEPRTSEAERLARDYIESYGPR